MKALLLVTALAAAGCHTKRDADIGMAVGGGIAVSGFIVVFGGLCGEHDVGDACATPPGVGMIAVGGAVAAVSLLDWAVLDMLDPTTVR